MIRSSNISLYKQYSTVSCAKILELRLFYNFIIERLKPILKQLVPIKSHRGSWKIVIYLIFDHLQRTSKIVGIKVHFQTTHQVQAFFRVWQWLLLKGITWFWGFLSFQIAEHVTTIRNNNSLRNNCHWKISTLCEGRKLSGSLVTTTAFDGFHRLGHQEGGKCWFLVSNAC